MRGNLVKAVWIVSIFVMLSVLSIPLVMAQEFPTKPVKLIIPSRAGGGHDTLFRTVTSVAVDYLGQPMIIQLKPGGFGAIGADYVAKSKPDGYTLLAGGLGWSSAMPAIEGRPGGPNDLVAVCRINYSSIFLVARENAPWKTFKELMAWMKGNPGKLIVGVGSRYIQDDFFYKKLMKDYGVSVKIVPYQGGGAQFAAVLGGHSDMGGASPSFLKPYTDAGKLTAILYLDNKRHPDYPDVPTAMEEGIEFESHMWRGVLAPKGTPQPIIDKLAAAFKKMTEDPTVKSMIKKFGEDIQYLGPNEFSMAWHEEYAQYVKYGEILKEKK